MTSRDAAARRRDPGKMDLVTSSMMRATRMTTAGVAALLLTLAACGGSSADSERSLVPSPTVAPTTTSTTTTLAPVTTVPPDTTTTTVLAETTTTVAPTTIAPAISELVLRNDGVGGARFGAEVEGVVAYVSGLLGPATSDSGWVPADQSPYGVCPGNEARGVRWGQLQLLFSDATSVTSGTRHLFAYSYGAFVGEDPAPVGLHTEGIVGLGSTVAQLRAAHPETEVFEDPVIGSGFIVLDGGLSGTLSGAAEDSTINIIYGGIGCGE
jgi:hypothetical protein